MARLLSLVCIVIALISCQCGELILDKSDKPPAVPVINSWADITEEVLPAVVKIELHKQGPIPAIESSAAGFIITPNGLVATSGHVVDKAGVATNGTELWVRTLDGYMEQVQIVHQSMKYDIAFLKLEDGLYPYLQFETQEALRQGSPVLTAGHTLGKLDWSVYEGIVSKTRANIQEIPNDWIQITAALNPGCSGGPVINRYGRVIGMNRGVMINLSEVYIAIPVDYILDALMDVTGYDQQ